MSEMTREDALKSAFGLLDQLERLHMAERLILSATPPNFMREQQVRIGAIERAQHALRQEVEAALNTNREG